MSRVLGWLRWLSVFLCTRHRRAMLAVAWDRERRAFEQQVLSLQSDLAVARAVIAGQRAEAERMTQATADAQDELERFRVQLGRQSMNKQEVAP